MFDRVAQKDVELFLEVSPHRSVENIENDSGDIKVRLRIGNAYRFNSSIPEIMLGPILFAK